MDQKQLLITLNITVVAIVALVAIVGVTAIVLNGPATKQAAASAAQDATPTGFATAAEFTPTARCWDAGRGLAVSC